MDNRLNINPKAIQDLLGYDDNGVLVVDREGNVYSTSAAIRLGDGGRYNTDEISVGDFLDGGCPDPDSPGTEDELVLISRIDLECMDGDWDVARECDDPEKNGDILAVIEMINAGA